MLAALGAPGSVAEAAVIKERLGDAGLGQREHAPPVRLFALDQTLVFEELEGRVHGAGARPPGAAAVLFEPLHDLVAVHRLVRQGEQDRRPDVAALGARPGAAAVAVRTVAVRAVAAELEARGTAVAAAPSTAGAARAAGGL